MKRFFKKLFGSCWKTERALAQEKSECYKLLELGKGFICNASHELRTPITIIKGFAETLYDNPNLPQPLLRDIVSKILRNCLRMESLVNNLLTLADIEHFPPSRLKPQKLLLIVDRCAEELLTLFPHVHLDIQRSEEATIAADEDFLALALMNLLHNAVKYSTQRPHITIKAEKKNKEVFLNVTDRGRGIPEPDLQYIFDQFYTVDKTHSRALGGAGLGLAIVKTILEKHGGRCAVSSQVGKGSCFTLVLPLLEPPLKHSLHPQHASP